MIDREKLEAALKRVDCIKTLDTSVKLEGPVWEEIEKAAREYNRIQPMLEKMMTLRKECGVMACNDAKWLLGTYEITNEIQKIIE